MSEARQATTQSATLPRSWWSKERREAVGAIFGASTILVVAKLLSPDPSGYGTHEHLFLLPCMFKMLTGLPCPFCGMTTAFAYLAEGAVGPALVAHILGPVAYLATWAILVAGIIGVARDRRPLPQWMFSQWAGRTMLLILLGGWVVNLVRFLGM